MSDSLHEALANGTTQTNKERGAAVAATKMTGRNRRPPHRTRSGGLLTSQLPVTSNQPPQEIHHRTCSGGLLTVLANSRRHSRSVVFPPERVRWSQSALEWWIVVGSRSVDDPPERVRWRSTRAGCAHFDRLQCRDLLPLRSSFLRVVSRSAVFWGIQS